MIHTFLSGKYLYKLSILFLITTTSCVFELDEYYNNPVDKNPTLPEIEVINLDIEEDTVYAYGGRTIHFLFKSSQQSIQGVKLLIDNMAIDSITSNNGSLVFEDWDVSNGPHLLTLQIFTNSGTGSIMDKLGGESLVFAKNWILLVDNTRWDNTQGTVENGLLKLFWEPYKAANFKNYIVTRGNYNSLEIAKTKSTEYIDKSYVGEQDRYAVFIELKDGSKIGWGSISLTNTIPELHYEATNENNYFIWWKRPRFYNAVDKYKITLNYQDRGIIAVNDTMYQIPLNFNKQYDFKYTVVPKNPTTFFETNQYLYQKSIWGTTGITIKIPYVGYVKHTDKDELTYTNSDSVYKYSLSTNATIQKKRIIDKSTLYGEVISPNGKYLMGYYYTNNSTQNYIIKSIETGEIKNIPGYVSYTGGISESINLSDTGIGLIRNYNGNHVLFDYLNNKILAYHYQSDLDSRLISSNGKHIITSGSSGIKLFSHNSATSALQYVLTLNTGPYGVKRCEFNTANPNQLLIFNNGILKMYDCDNSSIITQYSLSDDILNIDYFNGEILCSNNTSCRIRNLSDGEVKKEIPIVIDPHYSGQYHIYNRFIFSNNGTAYKVN